uniref:NR LBD domain-containing protein n=1 Tax=Plectus sambesii TaxID=2011161 RepID=A0A914UGI7_9BILA
MEKCLRTGMDPSGVQPKRDPIRPNNVNATTRSVESKSSPEKSKSPIDQQSSSSSTACTEKSEEYRPTTDIRLKDQVSAPLATVPKIFSGCCPNETSIIVEISKAYQQLQEKRIKSYATIVVKGTFERATGRKYACDLDHTMKSKANEFLLCGEFVNAIGQFANLHSSIDKFDLFKKYSYPFDCIDTCFRNRKNNWIETGQLELPDGTWMDMNYLKEFYMSGEKMRMHADPDEAVRMFGPSFDQLKNELARPMRAIDITDEETFALMGLVLFDGDNKSVSMETRMHCRYIRNRLFRELMDYCIHSGGIDDGPAKEPYNKLTSLWDYYVKLKAG